VVVLDVDEVSSLVLSWVVGGEKVFGLSSYDAYMRALGFMMKKYAGN